MYPTLRPGDRILFDRIAYKLTVPQPGDIVLARHSSRANARFIKRVAAPPAAGVLAPDECWLLGDNPDASTDSRTHGPFRREDIIARAWVIYWPRDRFRRL
jgi:nickel-type superoxide dismutase maturation protease